MEKHSILIIDDDDLVRRALVRILRSTGLYEIFDVSNAQSAIDFLATRPCGMLISDLHMPGMNGLELMNAVRQKYPGVVRIMLSGKADLETATSAINNEVVSRFITKPWLNEELLLIVRKAFETAEKTAGCKPS